MARTPLELSDPPELTPSQKLRLAIEMAEQGIAMKRRTLRRQRPEATDAEVDALLQAWLQERR